MAEKKDTAKEEVKQPGTAVVNWQEEMAKQAKEASQQEAVTGSSISLRAGMLSYGGQPVPENKLRVIIIGYALERTLYEGAFDPNNIRSPVCFALAKPQWNDTAKEWWFGDVAPMPQAPKPQHATCNGCPWDKWGTQVKDGKPGRGKRCQERRRLILIPAREAANLEPANVLTAEVAVMKTPVTSTKAWASYVQNTASLMNRPPHGVITEISTTPNLKNQFTVTFKAITALPDDTLAAIMQKRGMSDSILLKPYEEQEEQSPEDVAAAAAKDAGKKY